ncbi:site-specific DNA-methyltransferase [candidate division KSB1 bacterium]|nr:site-specific DNA-methyltransferase [candidate division KSB1 bacterium]
MIITGHNPCFETKFGSAFLGDSVKLLKKIPDKSVNLILTSPPFALQRKKEYGNVPPEEYVEWFISSFYSDFYRILKDDGSLVIDIGGSWLKGSPVRSLYHYELLIALCKTYNSGTETHQFYLAQDFFWYNPSKLPTPAEWVTVRRIRVKDAVNTIWWLSKTEFPKATNKKVLKPYSDSMKSLLKNGYKAKTRPSGHNISTKFQKDNDGAIPPNILILPNTESNSYYLRRCKEEDLKPHPARFPLALPEFFINFLTDEGDLILDPFAGSCVTGEAAELNRRKWICIELSDDYLTGAKFRFETRVKRPEKNYNEEQLSFI